MCFYAVRQLARRMKPAVGGYATIFVGSLAMACLVGQAAEAQQSGDAPAIEVPDPEEIELVAADDLILKATYYPSSLGKEAVPVVLLHAFKGERRDYRELAKYLQNLGHAVLAPDLRGHGESTRFKEPEAGLPGRRPPARERVLDASSGRMPLDEFKKMVTHDMETMKKFLMSENNSAKLNIEKLCVVGAEMGAVVALDWARLDWSWPPLAIGKQGQDVKALVLLSPTWSYRGLQIRDALALAPIRNRLAVLLLVGKGSSRDTAEAKRLYSSLQRERPKLDHMDREERAAKQDVFYGALNTSLQGTKMLEDKNLKSKIMSFIGIFIKRRLVDQDFEWKDRSRGLN